MHIRGVFLFLIFLLFHPMQVLQAQISGAVGGFVSREQITKELRLELDQRIGSSEVCIGWEGLVGTDHTGHETDWHLSVPMQGLKIGLSKNRPHITSQDAFRLVHENNYGQETITAVADYNNIRLGLFRNIPCQNEGTVDAQLLQGRVDHGSVSFVGTLLTCGSRIFVGQGEYNHKPWKGSAAWGIRYTPTEISNAFVMNAQYTGERIQIDFTAQHIEPNFTSLLAKTNKYTPDRKGVQWKVHVPLNEIDMTLNGRVHERISRTREYNQFSVELQSPSKYTSLLWRLVPTQAFVLRFQRDDTNVQCDVLNQTVRLDWVYAGLENRLSCDVSKRLARLEMKFSRCLDWRLIMKRDFIKDRNYFSLLVRREAAGSYVQLEWGEYDRGNIHAGFDTQPQLGISWGYTF